MYDIVHKCILALFQLPIIIIFIINSLDGRIFHFSYASIFRLRLNNKQVNFL